MADTRISSFRVSVVSIGSVLVQSRITCSSSTSSETSMESSYSLRWCCLVCEETKMKHVTLPPYKGRNKKSQFILVGKQTLFNNQ